MTRVRDRSGIASRTAAERGAVVLLGVALGALACTAAPPEPPPGADAFYDELQGKLLAAEATRRKIHEEKETRVALSNAHDSILARTLVEREVRDKVVTDEATRQYYEEHDFTIPEMAHARHIVVTPFAERRLRNLQKDDAKTDTEAREKIDRLKKELDEGADFATLAREWSEDITAADGGRLQPFPRTRMSK